MGLSIILVIVCLGLAVVGAIVAVIVVIAVSRREDFVNPFGGRKPESLMSQEVVYATPKEAPSVRGVDPVADQETAWVDWLVAQASAQTGVKLEGDPMVRERMINAVRNALVELKEQDTTTINLPFLTADPTGPKHFEIKFTRQMRDQIQ